MIDKLSYEQILTISNELRTQANIIHKLILDRNIPELEEFASTIERYSNFLQNTVDIYKDADKALTELKNNIK